MRPFSRIIFLPVMAAVALAAETTPVQTTPQPVARIEKAPDGFPLSLQGFFGKGAQVEASLREKTTGKSAWLKPGDTFGEWKLENADAESGRVVLSSRKRRVTLLQAGETPAETNSEEKTGTPKLKSMEDSVVRKKVDAILNDEKGMNLFGGLMKQSEDILRKSHPEYLDKNGQFNDQAPGASMAQAAEMKRLLEADSSTEAAAVRPVLTAYFDAIVRTQYLAKALPSAGLPEGNAMEKRIKLKRWISERDSESLRALEEADRIYLERTGGK